MSLVALNFRSAIAFLHIEQLLNTTCKWKGVAGIIMSVAADSAAISCGLNVGGVSTRTISKLPLPLPGRTSYAIHLA